VRVLETRVRVTPRASTSLVANIKKWLIASDVQVPYQDVRSLNAFEKYMAAHTWDGLLYIGDFIDGVSVSAHDIHNLKDREGRRLADEYKEANKVLDRHQQLIWNNNPYAKFVYLEGNHEERVARYINQHPEMAGLIDVPTIIWSSPL